MAISHRMADEDIRHLASFSAIQMAVLGSRPVDQTEDC
jgi:hypothetical protein